MSSAPNFNALARIYRWLEYLTFGPLLQRCRTHFLSRFTQRRHALVLGDGDGRFTTALFRSNPTIRVTAIDASPRMMQLLEQRTAPYTGRLATQIADLRLWTPVPSEEAPHYDLIVTHFFLDCLSTPEIANLCHRLAPCLAPNTLWLISEFSIPPTLFGRILAAPLVTLLYHAFRILTGLGQQSLPNHPEALAAAGWSRQSRTPHLCGLLVSEIWQHETPTPPLCGGTQKS